MKNPITAAMFQQAFDFLIAECKFKRKGKLYIRLVNDEVIQSVALFITNPMDVDISIGLFSVYEGHIFVSNDTVYCSELVESVKGKTKALLNDYGIIL